MVPSKFSTVNGGNNPMTASLLVVSNGSSFDVWIGSFGKGTLNFYGKC